MSQEPLQYRDPEEIERDLKSTAAANALASTQEEKKPAQEDFSAWEFAGVNAGVAVAASGLPAIATGLCSYLDSDVPCAVCMLTLSRPIQLARNRFYSDRLGCRSVRRLGQRRSCSFDHRTRRS